MDPSFIQSDHYPYPFNNPWVTNDENLQRTPENDTIRNSFLLPCGRDAFLPVETAPALDYSLDFSEFFNDEIVQDPTLLLLPLSYILQQQNPTEVAQIDSPSFEYPPEFDPILNFPSVQCLYNESFADVSNAPQYNDFTQLNEEAAAPLSCIKTESSATAETLPKFDPTPSVESKETHVSLKALYLPPVDTLSITINTEQSREASPLPEASTSSPKATPATISFECVTANELKKPGPKRRSKNSDEDADCGFVVERDARGKKFYQCKTCPDIGTYHRGDMMRHQLSSKHRPPSFECSLCLKVFTRPDALKRHLQLVDAHKLRPKRKYMGPEDDDVEVDLPRKRAKTDAGSGLLDLLTFSHY